MLASKVSMVQLPKKRIFRPISEETKLVNLFFLKIQFSFFILLSSINLVLYSFQKFLRQFALYKRTKYIFFSFWKYKSVTLNFTINFFILLGFSCKIFHNHNINGLSFDTPKGINRGINDKFVLGHLLIYPGLTSKLRNQYFNLIHYFKSVKKRQYLHVFIHLFSFILDHYT